ncbi:DUF3800 domain-containing protein [Microtetraspora sp. AC03309]|uniref:DUF3800 domain-containing protein n=1 Tax=Microtetraspora sp. AC03309 TaxID=2779376 RepID=UPI001E4C5801|nr:DUF3800 domain-containing protein [Microtetraspora sp. AC03309]MCC5578852.1 DUF3800 domain-containing protein [Microtetraspora sp. AC03309]
MSEVFMYADETGNLDYNVSGGGSKYFGIGTATFVGDHDQAVWQGHRLRLAHSRAGLAFPRGYHAKNDNYRTRKEVYDVIRAQAPRFDATFLAKENAHDSKREKGDLHLYREAWYLHFKEIAKQVTVQGDILYVVVATLGTSARKKAFEDAIREVCEDCAPSRRDVVVCTWDSSTSWGLQVADYGLWAVQRKLERGDAGFMWAVEPTLSSFSRPWG